MPQKSNSDQYKWLNSGNEIFPPMLAAIHGAKKSIRLEVYIFADDLIGHQFRDALASAALRGIRVSVMVDAHGSSFLPYGFWDAFKAAGGHIRVFNPLWLRRLGFRDHRKMLVCDESVAYIGGFNIAKEYSGDGITSGWCELGLEVKGLLVNRLADAFDDIFKNADAEHPKLGNRAHPKTRGEIFTEHGSLLLGGPGLVGNPFKLALTQDLAIAQKVNIVCAYFFPTAKIRRELLRVVKRGGKVRLILAAKSDVALSRFATQSLYGRLLKAGVEIYEYQPQILHAKLIIIDDLVYAGSSNLDPRSLLINYELMLKIGDAATVLDAEHLFEQKLLHCKRIFLHEWKTNRSFWERITARLAHFLLVRLDPLVARWQLEKNRNY
jgi:cardiolipin synthase